MNLSDIPTRLKVMRRPQAELARHLNLDPSSLVKTIKGDRRVQPAEVVAIEAFFGEKLDLAVTAPHPTRRRIVPDRIPVYGYAAAGGDDRIAYTDDQVLDYFEPPPGWRGGDDLFYVRIVGESMYPRYFSGEVIAIRRKMPPARGQDCLIEFSDNTALIKTYEGQREGKVFARQYNDEKTLAFEGASVRALHAVWKPGLP